MKDWNKELGYLENTRQRMWNDDYFEFLVKQVWKIDYPVKILDVGCGYGDLGKRLLPIIPDGSSYKGIDIAEDLIEKAREDFSNSKYNTEFEVMNLLEYEPVAKYDIVICQSVLRHIPEVKEVLKKMIASTVSGGLVICIEPSRRMENAGLYIDDKDFDIFENDEFLKERWQQEYANGGRDFLVGMKIPGYMSQMGLRNVSVRVNDYVDFISKNETEIVGEGKADSFAENKLDYFSEGKLDSFAESKLDYFFEERLDSFEDSKKDFLQNYGVDEKYSDATIYFSARCHLISFGVKS